MERYNFSSLLELAQMPSTGIARAIFAEEGLWQVGGIVIAVQCVDGSEDIQCVYNVVTTIGLQRCASHLASAPSQEWFTYLAIGDNDDNAASTEDLALTNETYRVALDSIFADGVTCFGSVSITASDVGAGAVVIKELGLFDADAGGNLICRQVLETAISITGAERIDVLWGVIVT